MSDLIGASMCFAKFIKSHGNYFTFNKFVIVFSLDLTNCGLPEYHLKLHSAHNRTTKILKVHVPFNDFTIVFHLQMNHFPLGKMSGRLEVHTFIQKKLRMHIVQIIQKLSNLAIFSVLFFCCCSCPLCIVTD